MNVEILTLNQTLKRPGLCCGAELSCRRTRRRHPGQEGGGFPGRNAGGRCGRMRREGRGTPAQATARIKATREEDDFGSLCLQDQWLVSLDWEAGPVRDLQAA